MGTVFRKQTTRLLPTDAELFTKAGQRFARWKAGNKTRTAKLTTGRDGSTRIVTESKTYFAKYRDGQGYEQTIPTGCRDESAARSVLGELERRAELVKSNVFTAEEDAVADQQTIALERHFDAYKTHQVAKGLAPVRITNTASRLLRMTNECGFHRLSDLSGTALERWLGEQTAKGMSPGNRNEYRQDWVTFGNWCLRTRRLLVNPFVHVPKANAKLDPRRQRRALTEAELIRLLTVTRLRPLAEFGRVSKRKDASEVTSGRKTWRAAELTFDELDAACERARQRLVKNPELVQRLETLGWERVLVYKTLALTGLRRGELASLTVGQLQLDGPHPFAVLNAADEKNRQGSSIALRADVAGELREWVEHKRKTASSNQPTIKLSSVKTTDLPSDSPLFNVPKGLVRILDRDCKLAGIAKKDDRGRTVDVHALRYSFATMLSQAGVAPRTAQAAMRHSTIDLTMNTYTDPRLLDIHGALNSLPTFSLDNRPDANKQRATGTDDLSARLPNLVALTVAPATGFRGLLGSFPGIASGNDDERMTRKASDANPKNPSKKALFAGFANKASAVGTTRRLLNFFGTA